MSVVRVSILGFLLLLHGLPEAPLKADDDGRIRIVTEWTEDKKPIRVDCRSLPIIGGGIGGASQSCADRLSLYATFSCFPMKKESVEAICPEWEGLQSNIDWSRVAELIDARSEERRKRLSELVKQREKPSDESDGG